MNELEAGPALDTDPILEAFNAVALKGGLEISITLFTRAGTFIGLLTGSGVWADALIESLRSAGGQAAPFGDAFAERRDILADDRSMTGHFIHLRRAFELRGEQWHSLEPSGLWRGRVSDVTGWSIGGPASIFG